MEWVDVDFQGRKLIIVDKVKAIRVIALTPYLAQQLATLPRINEFVFASMGWIKAAVNDGQNIPALSHIETLRVAPPELNG